MVNVGGPGAGAAPGAQWWYPSAMENTMQNMQNAAAVCILSCRSLIVYLLLVYPSSSLLLVSTFRRPYAKKMANIERDGKENGGFLFFILRTLICFTYL